MKKRLIAILILIMSLLCLASCRSERADLKFYVLKKEDVAENMADSALLAAAKRDGRVAFTGEDLRGWYWPDHQVLLRDLSVYGGAEEGGSKLFQAQAGDIFVLALGNRIIYSGGFASETETLGDTKEIYIEDGTADNFAVVCRNEYEAEQDPRNVDALYDYLADYDLLSGIKEGE